MPDTACLSKHHFEPHDVRETAARYRRPAPRQEWVAAADQSGGGGGGGGAMLNSSEGQTRGMPPYLLIFDLVFAGIGGVCTTVLQTDLYSGTARFFFIFLSMMWLWTITNARLNAYDPEDISFELFISLMMAGMMSVAFHLGPCFFQATADSGHSSVWSADANHCFDFSVSFTFVRLLLHGLGLYIGYHVPAARDSILRRETRTFVAWAPALLMMLVLSADSHPLTAPDEGNYFVEAALFATTALDALLTSGQAFLGDGGAWNNLCSGAGSVVPMNIKYFEARYERMMVISIGAIVAGSVSKMSAVQTTIQMRIDYRMSIFIGTPWIAFIVKVFYFDLSPHQGDASLESHAMRVSKRRGVAWTLLHLPLFGAVRWVGAALQALIDEESAQMYHGNLSDFTTAMASVCKDRLRGDGSLNCDAVADADAYNFSGSLVFYLLCATSVQVLHRGAGKRARRIGKKKRLLIRMAAIALLVGGTVTSVRLNWSIVTFFGWTTGLVTLLAAVELWGRGFSTQPDETATSAAAVAPTAAVAATSPEESSEARGLRGGVVPAALKRWVHHGLRRSRQAQQALTVERERSREERVSLHSPGHAGRSPVQPRPNDDDDDDDDEHGHGHGGAARTTQLGCGASAEALVEMPPGMPAHGDSASLRQRSTVDCRGGSYDRRSTSDYRSSCGVPVGHGAAAGAADNHLPTIASCKMASLGINPEGPEGRCGAPSDLLKELSEPRL